LLGIVVLIFGFTWCVVFAGFVFLTNYGSFYRTELEFRIQETDSPLHPKFSGQVLADSRSVERSIISPWSIQNAVDIRSEIKSVAAFAEYSSDEIVGKLKDNLKIVVAPTEEDLDKIILHTSNSDDGSVVLSAIFKSYVELLRDEELRVWEEQIAEIESNISFFEAVLDKRSSEKTSMMRDLTEESLRNDQKQLDELRIGFDEKASSLELYLINVSETEFDYERLLRRSVIPVLMPLLIGVLVVGVGALYSRRKQATDRITLSTPPSRGWSISTFAIPLVFALAAVLIPWMIQPAVYANSARIRIEPKAAPLMTPMQSFNGMLDLLKREPFKTNTLEAFLNDSKWVTSLDQYSGYKIDPEATTFYSFQEDPDKALRQVLSDNLEWKADEHGPGFFEVSFSSADPNDTTLILQTMVQAFRKRYSAALDVSYVGKRSGRAKKVMNFPVWRMIVFGIIGLMLGCVFLFVSRWFRAKVAVKN